MSSRVLKQFLETNLEDIKERGLFNTIDVVEGSNGAVITVNDQTCLLYTS
ncbi:8-amino-7-oxononanoate synthase, partial [Enterococcus hirae]